jgi:hypothetical protein
MKQIAALGLATLLAFGCRKGAETADPSFDYCAEAAKDAATRFTYDQQGQAKQLFDVADAVDIGQVKVGHSPDPSRYQVIIVPVGYEDATPVLDPLVGKLQRAYEGVDVQFVYLDTSPGIDIYAFEKVLYGDMAQAKSIKQQLSKYMPVDSLVFAVKSKEWMGSAYPEERIAFFAAESEGVEYISTHEIAHTLGLSDGYAQFYKDLTKKGANTELFTSLANLDNDVLQAYERFKPPIQKVGQCNGETLYTFGGRLSIMRDVFYLTEENLATKAIFTDVQKTVLNERAHRAVSQSRQIAAANR